MKKILSYAWTKAEVDWLNKALVEHPTWSNATIYNQFMYANPNSKHTMKATASKINTLRYSTKGCKWNEEALNKLAQLVSYEIPEETLADYFGVTKAAIAHQRHKLKAMGLLNTTPGQAVPLVKNDIDDNIIDSVKQLKFDLNQRDAIVLQNKLSAKLNTATECAPVAVSDRCINESCMTATEITNSLNQADRIWNGTTRELLIHKSIQLLDRIIDLLVD